MTKTELQLALAEATQTNKKTAGVSLDTLSALVYKTTKKTGEFVLPGFGKLVKQKRRARTGFNPKTQQKMCMKGFPERWIIILRTVYPSRNFPTSASGRRGRGASNVFKSGVRSLGIQRSASRLGPAGISTPEEGEKR
jgi:DNA-binding protein HU-beta